MQPVPSVSWYRVQPNERHAVSSPPAEALASRGSSVEIIPCRRGSEAGARTFLRAVVVGLRSKVVAVGHCSVPIVDRGVELKPLRGTGDLVDHDAKPSHLGLSSVRDRGDRPCECEDALQVTQDFTEG